MKNNDEPWIESATGQVVITILLAILVFVLWRNL